MQNRISVTGNNKLQWDSIKQQKVDIMHEENNILPETRISLDYSHLFLQCKQENKKQNQQCNRKRNLKQSGEIAAGWEKKTCEGEEKTTGKRIPLDASRVENWG